MRELRSLSEATTLRVGGVPRWWESVASMRQLEDVARQSRADGALLRVLGGGSNILVRDGELDCAVVEIVNVDLQHVDDGEVVLVTAGAGVSWDMLVQYTVDHGWWGLENLSAIPGTVGAGPVQNIGAYGVELSDVCVSVVAFDREEGRYRRFATTDMTFGYRDSVFKQNPNRFFIWEVTFRLSKHAERKLAYADLQKYFGAEQHPILHDIRAAVMDIRARKFPDLTCVGTAGSFFKNPILSKEHYHQVVRTMPLVPAFVTNTPGHVKIPAAYVLEQLGYKGYREGSVAMHDRHALVLVTYVGATAHAVDMFAVAIEKKVFEIIGVVLEREVQFFS